MKKRILSIVGAAALAVGFAATPAAAYTSPWHSTTSAYIQQPCGAINHGHTSTRAFIDSGGCKWRVAIRAQYNEFGSNYTTAWVWGDVSASVTRDRIFLHQFQY